MIGKLSAFHDVIRNPKDREQVARFRGSSRGTITEQIQIRRTSGLLGEAPGMAAQLSDDALEGRRRTGSGVLVRILGYLGLHDTTSLMILIGIFIHQRVRRL
jgi:hypothetical protein